MISVAIFLSCVVKDVVWTVDRFNICCLCYNFKSKPNWHYKKITILGTKGAKGIRGYMSFEIYLDIWLRSLSMSGGCRSRLRRIRYDCIYRVEIRPLAEAWDLARGRRGDVNLGSDRSGRVEIRNEGPYRP